MRKLEKFTGSFVDMEMDEELSKIVFILTYNDMFAWATSWGLLIVSDYDKPIAAYRDLYNYLKKNNFDFYDQFDKVEYPKEKTVESVEKYFKENIKIYNVFVNKLKDYNDYTRLSFDDELINEKD